MSGTARGKILPPSKFLKGNRSRGLRIPEEVFTLTINGRYVWETSAVNDAAIDIYMKPDPDTIRIVPWYKEPTAQVICDAFHLNDDPVDISPRHVLKRVLDLYRKGLAAGRGARARILSGARRISIPTIRWKPRSAARAARKPAARPMASMPPMISIRSSRTSTTTARPRSSMSTRCRMKAGRPSSRSISITAIPWSSPTRCSCSSAPCARRR